MKINEVETRVGITKKNIRFYEEQGLLSPRRNADNGYREYSEEHVQILQKIKLLRKLGVPIEEIRQMLCGSLTVADGMRHHLVSLEQEHLNLSQSINLCRNMQDLEIPLTELDAEALLSHMEQLEQDGTSFQNKQVQDVRIRYVAPILISVLVIGLLLTLVALFYWAYITAPDEAPPLGVLIFFLGICLFISGGVLLALFQRIHEIAKGEIDDAKHY